MQRNLYIPQALTAVVLFSVLLLGCGGGESSNTGQNTAPSEASDLTEDELLNGLGPIRELTLGPIDETLAATGAELFLVKCSACHKIDQRYIGPALADVTTRRTAPYIMNMILNPEEMVQRHPEAKKLLAEYVAPMANQSLTQEEARAILEYLRQSAP